MKVSTLSLAVVTSMILAVTSPTCSAQDSPTTGGDCPAIAVPRASKFPLGSSVDSLHNNDTPSPSSSLASTPNLTRHQQPVPLPDMNSVVQQRRRSFQRNQQIHLVNGRLRIRNIGPQRLPREKRGLLDDLVGKTTPTPTPDSAPAPDSAPTPSPSPAQPPSNASASLNDLTDLFIFPSPSLSLPPPFMEPTLNSQEPDTSSPPTTSDQPTTTTEAPPATSDEAPITTTDTTDTTPTTDAPAGTTPPIAPETADDTSTTRTHARTTDGNHGGSTSSSPGTSSSTVGARASTLPASKDERGSNTTSVTIGVVVAAILIAAGIGVWVFRKWKLSPSRQFKSKMRNSAGGGTAGAAAASSGHGDDPSEYDSYDNIFRPHPHESSVPMTMAGAPATVGVSMMGGGNGGGGGLGGVGGGGGMAAPEYEYEYPSQPPPMAHLYSHHQSQSSMSSAGGGSVTDYGQYRYPASTNIGYEHSSATGAHPMGHGGSPNSSHHMNGYGSQDYSQNDQFLRELRE
ncbi:hypothetical protein BG004_000263 [Podila humilis]|nr:hypothetical protein BG004_000263 [Podila humilis]